MTALCASLAIWITAVLALVIGAGMLDGRPAKRWCDELRTTNGAPSVSCRDADRVRSHAQQRHGIEQTTMGEN